VNQANLDLVDEGVLLQDSLCHLIPIADRVVGEFSGWFLLPNSRTSSTSGRLPMPSSPWS
jgi:hypothetical protein